VRDDCVFCLITRHQVDSSIIDESDRVLAIMDIDPVTPGRVLVLPKAHLPALAHAHLHVFPRFAGDGFAISGGWGSNPARSDLDARAAAIAEALATAS
jgi:histidine triad (HIT) family protein